MTRLLSTDVRDIAAALQDYNKELIRVTGASLNQIAAHAAGFELQSEICIAKTAVIPLTCGQGVIEGFSEAVAAIIKFMGFSSVVTENPDAAGVAEAIQKGADIIFLADDDRFMAVNIASRRIADNSEATGKGFAAALDLMTKGLQNKKVLLLGAGPVGKSAAYTLVSYGAELSVYDIDLPSGIKLAREMREELGVTVKVEKEMDAALLEHNILFDATPAKAFINTNHIQKETYIAAPGVPLGLSDSCLSLELLKLIHDPLQIGVATMMYEALKPNLNIA